MSATIPPKIESALAEIRRGDLRKAQALSEEVLAQNPNEPNALQVLGIVAWREARLAEARVFYERANAAAPNHAPILNSLGVICRDLGDLPSSRLTLERAVKAQPDFSEAWVNLGLTLAALGADAKAAFQEAISRNPGDGAILAKYAHYLESRHELSQARDFAWRAIAAYPSNFLALSTLVSVDTTMGAYESALVLCDRALAIPDLTPTNRAVLHGKRARVLEKLHRFEDSFTESDAANKIMRALWRDTMEKAVGPRSPSSLARLEAFARAAPRALWPSPGQTPDKQPVFLVGFPRSGTTMLDQILSTFKSVCVIEEKENIADAWMEILVAPDGLDRWARMGPADAERLREAYWRRAQPHMPSGARLVIDKLPLDTALLGLIHFLFPDSRIIFALRDPRDVILSCFQQTFGMNAAMYQFLDLQTAATYYDQVMRLGALWRDKLPLAVHEVRYEKVVADFDAEIRALLLFLDLPWSDDLRRFHETALKRVIRTPSAKQVIQPLYDSSVGKWRKFEKELAPVRALLDPWAERFGYQV